MSGPVAVALLSAALNGAVGALSYLRGRRQPLYRSYAILGLSFALWGLAYAAAWPAFDDDFWMKVLYTPLSWLPAATLSFVWCFTGLPERERRLRTVPLYAVGLLLIGLLWTGAVSRPFFRFAFTVFLFPPCALCVGLLYRFWREETDDRAERNRRGYLFAASLIAAAGGISDFLTPFGFPSLANLALMTYSVIVVAAITRHHLLDLSAAAGRAAAVAGAALALGLALTGLSRLTQAFDGSPFMSFFLTSLLLLLAAPPVAERALDALRRRFFARQHRRELALEELEKSLEGAAPAEIAAAAERAVEALWGASSTLCWGPLSGLDAQPRLDEPLRAALAARPRPATLADLGRDDGPAAVALLAALRERHCEAVVPVLRDGAVAAALFLGPPREGFYDLAAVRWHARLSLVLGRAVHAAELTAGILRADRLAQLGTLSAGIAHEIRNPLSAMLGALELLQQGLPPEQERQFLEVLREEVLRLDGTVTELLDYSSARPASARCEWTQVFDRVEKLTRRAGLTLERAGAPAELAISGGHLQQILVNLVKNAARAAESAAEPRVDARADVRGGRATITVGDNGPGIAPEIMTRLFTPFASAAPGGTGLGLAMVKRLAELYGGRVWAENRAVGARFCVELPLAAASPAMLE